MKISELLPIGSIVLLREAEKKLMIYGVKQTNNDNGVEYDYIGVMYPEGNVGADTQFMFNHEHIGEVIFRGYEDKEREMFIQNLSDFYNER